jgi:hypothetical protein
MRIIPFYLPYNLIFVLAAQKFQDNIFWVIAEPLAIKIGHKNFVLPDGKNTKKVIKGKTEIKSQYAFHRV